MRITDFIRLQNKELVESANITFKLLLPLSYGGKWFFYCNDGDTVDDLCKWVESDDKHINVDITWPYNAVSVEENGEDKYGKPIVKYVFDLNDYPEYEK